MTNVFVNKSASRYILKVEGHSGYGEYGTDIVCAGISTLVDAFSRIIEDADDKGKIYLERFKMEDGLCDFMWIDKDRFVDNCFIMTLMGLEALQEAYPENVKIEYGCEI